MPSLHARLLVAASVVLLAFLGLAGAALDRAFRESALAAVQERLQAQVYMLLAAAELDSAGLLRLPEALPDARFSTPGSGLYGEVVNERGERIWRSPSMVGLRIPYPLSSRPGEGRFASVLASDSVPLFAFVFTVAWETAPPPPRRYAFRVAESQESYRAQVAGFRRSMWVWFSAAAVTLVALQGILLRWGLAPVRRVAGELAMIERGEKQELTGPYPSEIRQLTENLNALIRHGQAQLDRYRKAMGDLAHSLKTPLAVLQGVAEKREALHQGEERPGSVQQTVQEQVARMRQTVDYQLQRAAASGKRALSAPVAVEPVARRVLESLGKVYADRSLAWSLEVEPGSQFDGDEGDFVEVLGNLADNAFKWARSRVEVRGCRSAPRPGTPSGLVLEVEDDGAGIALDSSRAVLERGVRGDPNVAGQGIGLAVVRDIVEQVYGGQVLIDEGNLGGARVTVRF